MKVRVSAELANELGKYRIDAGTCLSAIELAQDWLSESYPGQASQWQFKPLGIQNKLEDSPARLVAIDSHGMPRAIVFISSPQFPRLVARGAERALEANQLLGAEVGSGVLPPIRVGKVGDLTMAAYPWRLEVGSGMVRSRIRRPFLRAWLLRWLRDVVLTCAARRPEPADKEPVHELLVELLECELLSDVIKADLIRSIQRLDANLWQPRIVIDHNDLWPGNILINRDPVAGLAGTSPYVVIDWAGANVLGGGFVDVVRVARCFGLSNRRLTQELLFRCKVLSLVPKDVIPQLLFSLGWLYRHIECFPIEQFEALAADTLTRAHTSIDRLGK